MKLRTKLDTNHEYPDFINSTIILIDITNPYVSFDSNLFELVLRVLPLKERTDLVNLLLKEAGCKEYLNQIDVRPLKFDRFIRMLETTVENMDRFYRKTIRQAALD